MKKQLFPALLFLLFTYQKAQSQTNANTWTWIKGANTPNQPGYYGTQGVAGVPNTPGARFSGVNWTYNGKLYLFSGEGYDGAGEYGDLSDLWEFDPATNNWRWLKGSPTEWAVGNWGTKGVEASTNLPGFYRESCAWAVGNLLYFFGGVKTSVVFQNALWVYNVNTNNWTWLKGAAENESKQPNYGILGTPASTNMPGGRNWSTSFTLNGKLYLFGGYGVDDEGNTGALNDLWEYVPATNNWTWLKGSKLRNPTGTYGSRTIYAAGNNPSGRYMATGWVANNHLYLFGGSGEYNDLWEFDPITNNWRWVQGSNTLNENGVYNDPFFLGNNTPGARRESNGVGYLGNLYLFGGSNNNAGNDKYFNDLWVLRPSTNFWTYLKGNTTANALAVYGTQNVTSTNSKPGSIYKAFLWQTNKKIYLFGGLNGSNTQNNLWEYIIPCSGVEDFYSIKNGNWGDPTVWSCGRIPNTTEQVTIKGHTINIEANFGLNKIIFEGGNITMPVGSTLTYYPIVP